MPTYDYECDACGHKFEKFHSMSAASIKKCPECGKLTVRRLIGTGAGIIFKGSGFYQTDYRSDSYRQAAKKDSAASTTTSSTSSSPGTNDSSTASTPASDSSAGGKGKSEPKAGTSNAPAKTSQSAKAKKNGK
jgi:putative FmdB family regulatory protein